MTVSLRKVMPKAILLMFILLVSGYGIAYSDNVAESDVLAPAFPANAPGIQRPFPHDGDKFTYAIIGDKTGGGLQNWPIFDRAIDEINGLHPDFAIMVGDQIQGYTDDEEQLAQEWKEFYQHANRIQVPFFPLPGNHDISNSTMYEYWKANFGKTYYSFDYRDCHFILLNTEEGRKTGETALGKEQMEWIHGDINGHRNSKHFFLFMHRPIWYESYEASGELAQWKTIESWLEGLPHTVFAGHFHQLTYEERDNSPYYVLSATGGELTPSDVIALGEFHHYTMVTVDGDDIHIAVVQPGGILSHDVATREFQKNADKVFTYGKRFPDFTPSDGKGEFLVNLRNTLDKPITAQIKFLVPGEVAADVAPKERYWDDPYLDQPNYESSWMVYPREVKYILQPGEAKEVVFAMSYSAKNLLPFPYYSYSIFYGDILMKQSLSELGPVELKAFTLIRDWQVAGPFDLGIRGRIPVNKDSSLYVPEFMKDAIIPSSCDLNC